MFRLKGMTISFTEKCMFVGGKLSHMLQLLTWETGFVFTQGHRFCLEWWVGGVGGRVRGLHFH